MANQIPLWIQTIQLEDWSTQIISNQDLHYQLSICKSWETNPKVTITPLEIEHFFQGSSLGEALIIKFMDNVNLGDNICNWVDAPIAMIGFPILSIQQTLGFSLQLLQWRYEGNCLPLTGKLKVDEAHLFQGLAKVVKPSPTLIRLYILLVRRNIFAWQIVLSISSACLPNSPEKLVEANDHVRAGSILGDLYLL